MTPLVSIIMPAYNRRATVAEAIGSAQAQTVKDFELIVVDDGSDDGTPLVVEALATSDDRIRLIRAEHRGRSAARNMGIDAARGEWLMFLDSDDLLLPHALDRLVECAKASEHGAAYGSWRNINEDGRCLDDPSSDPRSTKTIELEQLLEGTGFVIHAQLLRRELVGDVRFSTDLSQSEDRDFWFRLAEMGVAWKPTSACVCEYRITPRGVDLEMFRMNFGVLTSAFKRARKSGWASRGVDVSVRREASLLATRAHEFAHRTLLIDESTEIAARAVRMVADRFGLNAAELMPERAASVAFHLVPFSDCQPIESWALHFERYWAAIGPWWSRCAREGWAVPSFVFEGREKLIVMLVNARDDLPSRVINRCPASKRIVLLGFGRNGVRLAQELVKRDIPVIVRDDNLSQEQIAERFPHAPVTLIPHSEPYQFEDVHVMTLLYDDVYLSMLPHGLDIVRWRDGCSEIDQELRARMNSVWPKPTIKARLDRDATALSEVRAAV